MMNTVFDCHMHVEGGIESYDLNLAGGNIIYNSIESHKQHAANYSDFYHSLIFDYQHHREYIQSCINTNTIHALKIHTRLQKIPLSGYDELIQSLKDIDNRIPVIYDAFYSHGHLDYQPSLRGLIKLLDAFPERRFIIAHSGGYNILKYFFHLRGYKNVGYDLSFSLQYLSDSSCYADLIKLIKFTDKSRIFYGSDFPSASPSLQYGILNDICKKFNLSGTDMEGIFKTNWINFIKGS
ncbi:MAG: amidohydrolase [Bacteroidota bacterium]|nr:amidohydrolase [Bacteroidota bacterium]